MLFRSVVDDDDDDDGDDSIDVQVAYSRPRFNTPKDIDDVELSDYVKIRLAVARAKAMQKYYEKCNT